MTDPAPPSATIALLGASNLTRGISTVVETLRLRHGSPLRIFAALGHGRSYGMRSNVLGRGIVGILESGLWHALSTAPPHSPRDTPRFALLTDIGNDVMYEAPPQQIINWIGECVERLVRLDFDPINITALPIESIRRVKPWQYAIVRAILFPSHHIAFDDAVQRGIETQRLLEEFVASSSQSKRLRLLQHQREWYGFDPIHIRARHWAPAWERFLAREDDERLDARPIGSFRRLLKLRTHMPAEYTMFGVARTCPQPLSLADGSTIAMY